MRLMILCASLFFLTGCYTIDTLYVVHVKHGVCEERKVTDQRTLASKRVKVMPLSACDGYIAISPEQFAEQRGKDKK